MSANLTGLIYVLVIFSGSLILIVLGYLLWLCYKKIKHRNPPTVSQIERSPLSPPSNVHKNLIKSAMSRNLTEL